MQAARAIVCSSTSRCSGSVEPSETTVQPAGSHAPRSTGDSSLLRAAQSTTSASCTAALRRRDRRDLQAGPEAFGEPLAAGRRGAEDAHRLQRAHRRQALQRVARLEARADDAHRQRALRRQPIDGQRRGGGGAQPGDAVAVDQRRQRHRVLVEQRDQVARAPRARRRGDQLAAHRGTRRRHGGQAAQPDAVAARHRARRHHRGLDVGRIGVGQRGDGAAPVGQRRHVGVGEEQGGRDGRADEGVGHGV